MASRINFPSYQRYSAGAGNDLAVAFPALLAKIAEAQPLRTAEERIIAAKIILFIAFSEGSKKWG